MIADLLDLLDRYAQSRIDWWRWWRYNHVTWYGFDGQEYSAWRWELEAIEQRWQDAPLLLPPAACYCNDCGTQMEADRCPYCDERQERDA